MDSNQTKKNLMLDINKNQKQYYEFDSTKSFEHGQSFISDIWDKIRDYQYQMTDFFDLNKDIFDVHLNWLGDLEGKKVLDLGCFTGNELSLDIARKAESYFAVDLSETAIGILEQKLIENNISNAKCLHVDFLSDDFSEMDFDFVYAKSIFHHFKYFDTFLDKLKTIVKKGGRVISFDPLNTYLPLKILRAIYRPLQNDKDWEYPFTRETIRKIQNEFIIKDVLATMGKTKYALPLYLISKKMAGNAVAKWKKFDSQLKLSDPYIWKCLRISLLLEKK